MRGVLIQLLMENFRSLSRRSVMYADVGFGEKKQ